MRLLDPTSAAESSAEQLFGRLQNGLNDNSGMLEPIPTENIERRSSDSDDPRK